MASQTIWHLITFLCLCCHKSFLHKSLMGSHSSALTRDDMRILFPEQIGVVVATDNGNGTQRAALCLSREQEVVLFHQ